ARLLQLAGSDVEIEEPEDVTFLGITAKIGARIVLQPSFAISLEQMKEKVKGKIRISRKSELIIDGQVVLDGLELDGAMTVRGPGGLTNKVLKNAGRSLEAIPSEELPSLPPALQIRGYRLSQGEVEEVKLGS
ncbi:unnamed protein product, partial [Polarella glacialis]